MIDRERVTPFLYVNLDVTGRQLRPAQAKFTLICACSLSRAHSSQ
jgi:hypothetical protein